MKKINLKNSHLYEGKNNSEGIRSIAGMGEDIVIERMLEQMNISSGVIVDVGSWDGWHLSNVGLLLNRGFSGLMIEGDSNRVLESKNRWSDRNDIDHRDVFVDFEDNGIDSLIENSSISIPNDFEIFNLDIDSYDFWVWKSLTYKPKIVCVEHSGHNIDYDRTIPIKKEWAYSVTHTNYGASAKSLYRLGTHKGYILVSASRHNLIFCDSKYSDLFESIDGIDVDWFKNILGVSPGSGRVHRSDEHYSYNPEVS